MHGDRKNHTFYMVPLEMRLVILAFGGMLGIILKLSGKPRHHVAVEVPHIEPMERYMFVNMNRQEM